MRASLMSFCHLILLLFIDSCSVSENVSGTGSETGHGSITGAAFTVDGEPAVSVHVNLRAEDYVKTHGSLTDGSDTTAPALPKTAASALRTTTDKNGRFTLDSVAAGKYVIEINDGVCCALLQKITVEEENTGYELPESHLQPFSSIRGTLRHPQGKPAFILVQVYGLERLVITDAGGAFTVPQVPEGNFNLRFIPLSAELEVMDYNNVTVVSGEATDIGTVTMTIKPCEDCDILPSEMMLPVTFWDFDTLHPDFESIPSLFELTPGLVLPVLGDDRKPIASGVVPPYSSHPEEWFRVNHHNTGYCGELLLKRDLTGERLFIYENPWFFPMDTFTDSTESPWFTAGDGNLHNYHFTMEAHVTFKYRGGETFMFGGDDDIFVFINNMLVSDLGGSHDVIMDTVQLDKEKENLKIRNGNYYHLDIFYCERKTGGAEFNMTAAVEFPPPATADVYIADGNLSIIHDHVIIGKGESETVFHAVTRNSDEQTIGCYGVPNPLRRSATGTWALNDEGLGEDSRLVFDPADYDPAVYWLTLENGDFIDSLMIVVEKQ
jgi:fibro-slime domain-containing protein